MRTDADEAARRFAAEALRARPLRSPNGSRECCLVTSMAVMRRWRMRPASAKIGSPEDVVMASFERSRSREVGLLDS